MAGTTLAVLVGNRGFFPDHLCDEGRQTILRVLKEEGIEEVALTHSWTPFGSVETHAHAKIWADKVKRHPDPVHGVLVTLPNFGDERGIADALRLANLGVPVLVHAFPDDPTMMDLADRRDSFCGKLSACNNLRQYGIPFTLTSQHTMDPTSDAFRADLRQFTATCRVVAGLKNARIGAIGARPAAFNTVRCSEKLLERAGISTVPIDLSEIFGRMGRLDDKAPQVCLAAVKEYICVADVPEEKLIQMAKLATVINDWMGAEGLVASAVQCWTSIEEYMGIVPCAVMSMMSERLVPSACEVDVTGAISMLALQLASNSPAGLVDLNNNYGDHPDKCVLFHCSNLPRSLFGEVKMGVQDIIGGSVGVENTYGTCVGQLAPSPISFLRLSTDDHQGRIVAYYGQGEITDDSLQTFGGAGVAFIPQLQKLLKLICELGLEHHVAITQGHIARAIHEAASYLDWAVYQHNAPEE